MSAALKLEIYQNGEFVKEVAGSEDELWVGRDNDCVIRLEDRAISRKHGFFKATTEGVEFEKRSKFGQVRVNGKEVEQASLKSGDRVEMGPYEIRVKSEENAEKSAKISVPSTDDYVEPMKTIASLPEIEIPVATLESDVDENLGHLDGVEPVETSASNAAFEAALNLTQGQGVEESAIEMNTPASNAFDFGKVNTDGQTKVIDVKNTPMKGVLIFGDGHANVTQYDINEDQIVIGRSQTCHIVLEDKKSSRKHSIILRKGDKYFLKDQGSANGTLLNGLRVDEQELQSGDVMQIGETQFTFQLMQADYEQKKDQFISVPQEAHSEIHSAPPQMKGFDANPAAFAPPAFEGPQAAQPAPDFAAPPPASKSLIGKYLERYRAMNTKQQIIWGVIVLGGMYLLMWDDAPQKRAQINVGQQNKQVQVKKDGKKPGGGVSFESLTPEQQRYIETQYQLAFDLYKTRDYDSSLLEVGKIFSLVQDYKNAREIEAFAREGKRKLEAQEEERKRQEAERQAQLKLKGLIEQAGFLMQKKKYDEAETVFSEIELIEPENQNVAIWRKQMVAERERIEREAQEAKRAIERNKSAWADFDKAKALATDRKYWDALDAYDDLITREVTDKQFVPTVKAETKRVEGVIASERDPLMASAKDLEQSGSLSDAYKKYQEAFAIDPTWDEAKKGMDRIRGVITGKAKAIYAEGVFAESYSDFDTAEKRYHEVMNVVPAESDYFVKAQKRLKKLMVFRQPATDNSTVGLPNQ